MADAGIVTADVTVWADAGSELPADPAGVVTVGVASLADAGKVTVGVADLAVAGVASLAEKCFRPFWVIGYHAESSVRIDR